MTRFTKQPDGSWRFETSQGRTFEARRNESGFAGRQWELTEITWTPVADGRYHEMRTRTDLDQFATRGDAVAHAEWLGRDFWAEYEAYLATIK